MPIIQPTKVSTRQSDVFQADVESYNVVTEDVSGDYRLVVKTTTGNGGTQEYVSIVLASEAPEPSTKTFDSYGASSRTEVTTVEAVDQVITRTTKQRLENGVVVSSFSSESNG
jgi:hypothetical protein